MAIPIAALMTIGLVGCGTTNKGAMETRNTNETMPIGYHSNDNYRDGGNVRINRGNDGPITEMMEGPFNTNGNQVRRVNYGDRYRENDIVPFTNTETQYNDLGARFNRNNMNNQTLRGVSNRTATPNQINTNEREMARKIANAVARVKNVDDVRTVVYGNDVLVGVIMNSTGTEQATKAAIRRAASPHLKGKNLMVVTDENTFSRILEIDNNLRNGNTGTRIGNDIRDIFRSLRDAVE